MAGEQYLKCTIIDPGLALTTIIHLYILADKFNVSELRDRVIEELLDMEWKRFMDWEHIELVYGNTMPGSMMLRKLAVKSIQQYGRINELEKPSSFSSALGEFFFDFAKYRDQTAGSTQGSTADIEHDNRCAWHEHGDEKKEGAFCPTRGPR
ncbi:hypothetical protein EV356DRAFT_496674 [Viridothelium virens]|uniref:BTB domain-containing protein n=1 Tax=Viridothelium virens TaxID=1048519 RepID=A0A6A6HH17_VIRVR|nr:hypothetical protein EV356DRAFT_496674 [Viridothelium virens]